MRFDNYILKLSDRPGYPEAMELNGDAFDFNTFRKRSYIPKKRWVL